MNTSPKYTQAGVNGGEPTTLPAIASPDRFSQNTPLASAVNSVLHVNQTVDTRYISVFSKAGTIKLLGTVRKSDLPTVLSIVKKVPGVKSIDNQLQIK
jgi:osmotically-inducible protein OsmY